MKRIILALLISTSLLGSSCSNGQHQHTGQINAQEFAKLIQDNPGLTILDVRSPGEYSGGHIAHAENIDWNSADFDKKTAGIDKNKPILVYCLSGGRSASAAARLREQGFKDVVEMQGGMMKWRAAGLPETKNAGSPKAQGLDQQAFEALLDGDKVVLVDFYADWCAPCKKMLPYLEEIAQNMGDKVKVVRINADENRALCEAMHIESIPVLQVYKNKSMTWNHEGFIEKERIVEQLQ